MARNEHTAGYTMGSQNIPKAPITTQELREMETTVTLDDEDREMLRRSGKILEKDLDGLVHAWVDFILDHEHLNEAFSGPEAEGEIVPRYVKAVRERVKEWVRDTAGARYDQEWLDYQFEIGRRLHRTKKNQTDGVDAIAHVPFRHLLPATVPMVTTLRPCLERDGASAEEVDMMLAAWTKSLVLQVTLWSYPYIRDKDY